MGGLLYFEGRRMTLGGDVRKIVDFGSGVARSLWFSNSAALGSGTHEKPQSLWRNETLRYLALLSD